MANNNISGKKEYTGEYASLISPQVLDELYTKMLDRLLIQKKYSDKDYSAKQLAIDLGTNSRYISAVVRVKFNMNYTSLVNKFRIEEAMRLLVDRRYAEQNMEDISDMVGFANRQSFYTAFERMQGCTPREYRVRHAKKKQNKKNDSEKKKSKK